MGGGGPLDILAKQFNKETALVSRRIVDETIIVPVRSNVGDLDFIYTLNDVGGLIWELIDGHTSIGRIVEVLCRKFDVGPEEAAGDVADFISSLEAAGLVRATQDPFSGHPAADRG